MKFDPKDGQRLQSFIGEVSEDLIRVLRPGAFCLMFSQPRLSHRTAAGMEDAGFEIRDQYAWRFTKKTRAKAAKQEHWIRKRSDWTDRQKERAIRILAGRRTAQLRPNFESIVVGQKPAEGNLYENFVQYRTGLVETASLPNLSTVFTVEKEAKEQYNGHLTVKPVEVLEQLIEVFTMPGQTVLDPFLGSGSTMVAAMKKGRDCIGMEIDPSYVEIAEQRIQEALI